MRRPFTDRVRGTSPGRWPDRKSLAITAVALVPILVAIVRGLASHRAPLGDNGLIALRAGDVLSADQPWFGTWTSASLTAGIDFNNPSPLHFEALSLFVKPFGVSAGSIIAAGVLNIVAVIVAIRQGFHLAARRGELLLAVGAVALSWSLGSEMLTDIWQPHNLVLPFFAFLACCVTTTGGRWRSLPWAVGIGSLVVGAHLSFTYITLALLAVAVAGGVVVDRRRGPAREARASRDGWRHGVMWALVVGLLAWLQPIGEQFFGYGKGNLGRLLEARSNGESPIGAKLGVRLVAQVVALPPWFLRDSFTGSIPETAYSDDGALRPAGVVSLGPAVVAVLVVLAVLSALTALAWRRRERATVALLAVALTGVLGALATTTVMPAGILGLAPHQLRWLWPVATITALAIIDAVDRLFLRGHVPARVRHGMAVGALGVLVVVNLPLHDSDLGPSASRDENDTVRSLMDQLEGVDLPGPTLFDGSTLIFAEPFSGPVLAALTESNEPIRAGDESFARQLGEHRRRRGDERWSLQVRQGDSAAAAGPGETLLASAVTSQGVEVAVVLIELDG